MISDNDFATVMDEFSIPEGEVVAVGVSGGADSICLCRMLARCAEKSSREVLALTVDHGLRAESASEAKQVHKWLSDLKIPHKTLIWQGEKPKTAIEEEARLARYALLTDECKKQGIKYLCLAHNKNDNVETFFIRLAKSSGVDGLSGIKPESVRNGIVILRPLLNFTREQIKATNNFMKQPWIEDPSNENEIYERVRFRKARSFFDSLGLSLDAVAKTMDKLSAVSCFLSERRDDFCRKYVMVSDFGFLKVNLSAFLSLEDETARRVLEKVIGAVAGEDDYVYPLRTAKVSDLMNKIRSASFKSATLGGAKITKKDKNKWLHIVKEARSAEDDRPAVGKHIVWDRFVLDFDEELPKGLYVGKLGDDLPEGLKDVKKIFSADVLKTIPAIRDKDGLLFVPLLGYKRSKDVKCNCTFKPFRFK